MNDMRDLENGFKREPLGAGVGDWGPVPSREDVARAIYEPEAQPVIDEQAERITGPRPWEWLSEAGREYYLARADALLALFERAKP